MTTTNIVITSALDEIYVKYPDFMFYVQRNDLEKILQDAIDKIMPNDLTLSSSKPDFEAITLQLTQELQNTNAWKDITTAAVGQTLIRNISAGIGLLHFAIVRASQNTFIKPGVPKSAVFNALNTLGVNPRRKIPAKIETRITVPDHQGLFVIPRFTQFTIANQPFFNRQEIVYSEFELVKTTTLVQGTFFTQSGAAIGNNYETIEIGYENYAISDEDVYVYINDEMWEWHKTAVWNVPKRSKSFFVKSEETGNIAVMFGNDAYGKRLSSGDDIRVVWFETLGASVVNIASGTVFDMILPSGEPLLCETTGNVYGFDDELSMDFYVNMGPFLRSAEHGAVRRIDYPTVATRYPAVRDALFRGQAELAPGKRNWMNIIEGTVITNTAVPMTSNEWDKFVDYMQENSVAQLEIIRRDPLIIEVDYSATVYCSSSTQLKQIKAILEAGVKNFNIPRRGSIGYSIYESNLVTLLEGDEVDQVKIQNLDDVIEYVRDIKVTYSAGFDPSKLPEGTGIDSENNVIADFFSYVAIRNVTIDTKYTPRRQLSGRRDLNIG